MTCGVYQILNNENGKKYIGSSSNIEGRWWQHRQALSRNEHGNAHLQSAWNRYGVDSFSWSILVECCPDDLLECEQGFLPKDKTIDALRRGGFYNAYPVAGSPRGVEQSEESRRKKGEKLKGRKFSDEHKRKLGEASKGRPKTALAIRILAERNKNRVITEDEKERLRTMNIGKKHSDEHRRRISEALQGKKHSEERRKNISMARKAGNAFRREQAEANKAKGTR